jgi:hypothetical protein
MTMTAEQSVTYFQELVKGLGYTDITIENQGDILDAMERIRRDLMPLAAGMSGADKDAAVDAVSAEDKGINPFDMDAMADLLSAQMPSARSGLEREDPALRTAFTLLDSAPNAGEARGMGLSMASGMATPTLIEKIQKQEILAHLSDEQRGTLVKRLQGTDPNNTLHIAPLIDIVHNPGPLADALRAVDVAAAAQESDVVRGYFDQARTGISGALEGAKADIPAEVLERLDVDGVMAHVLGAEGEQLPEGAIALIRSVSTGEPLTDAQAQRAVMLTYAAANARAVTEAGGTVMALDFTPDEANLRAMLEAADMPAAGQDMVINLLGKAHEAIPKDMQVKIGEDIKARAKSQVDAALEAGQAEAFAALNIQPGDQEAFAKHLAGVQALLVAGREGSDILSVAFKGEAETTARTALVTKDQIPWLMEGYENTGLAAQGIKREQVENLLKLGAAMAIHDEDFRRLAMAKTVEAGEYADGQVARKAGTLFGAFAKRNIDLTDWSMDNLKNIFKVLPEILKEVVGEMFANFVNNPPGASLKA